MAARANDPPFSRVWATVPRAALDAGLTQSEFAVLVSLMAYQGPGGELSRPAEEMAEECGLHAVTVRKALAEMTRKEFRAPDGTAIAMLSRVRAGRRGSPAVYRLNVPREWDGGSG